ncbi:heparinase II/III domain-containing protein [Shewanella sp. HL-SH4]|uniref:heparinase II/III domain-containing protein n=1 Tax=Shewanella sp. HL-SH4 TaxID=3436240 RepID=UPI003EBFFCC7
MLLTNYIPTKSNCNFSFYFSLNKHSYLLDMKVTCLNQMNNFFDVINREESFPKLYVYNFHYFDFLNNPRSPQKDNLEAIYIWINDYEYQNKLGGDAYPTSLRIVNWIKWATKQTNLQPIFYNSLYNQSKLLYANIEYEIDGNHLFANGKALIFYGIYFDGDWAEKCLNKGLKIIINELDRQVLKDGGNFELSPMYHGIMLEDLLDLYILALPNNFNYENIIHLLKPYIEKMIDWLKIIIIDKVTYPHFNDSTQNVAPSPKNLFDISISLGFNNASYDGSFLLAQTGYCVLKSKAFSLLCDVANVGPDYIPGHAHADTLSYELWANGKKLICNLGISEYGTGPRRLYERGTSSHSTVEINGKNSTNVWSGFRVAERARILNQNFNIENNILNATHNGYKNVLHSRQWILCDDELEIIDIIKSKKNVSFKLFHHLTPNVYCEKINDHLFKINDGISDYTFELVGLEQTRFEKNQYAIAFNVLEDTTTIVGSGCSLNEEHVFKSILRKIT